MRRSGWLAAVLVLVVTGCGAGGASSGATATSAAPTTTTTPAGQARALPVYYVAETPAGLRLFREFHRVVTADPASDAVREVLAEPRGLDPDYGSHWPPGAELRSPVTSGDGAITVDLSGVTGGANLGTELAELTVQQLVFTVQGALQSTDPVRILADGEPVAELFGAVSTAEPVQRADPYAVRSLVQIDDPANGARVGSPVVVRGEAAVFEATLPWEVRRDGQVVLTGVAQTAEGQRFAPFEFELALEPGEYVVAVTEDDPSGGEGRPVLRDTKTITVAG